MGIFKACDVRGRYGDDLTAEIALDFGRAVGSELAGRTVAVGGDVRPSTLALKPAVIAGLLECGCRVIDLGILPTPAFYFGVRSLGAAGGVMVTGSHNPRGDNGFKVILGSLPITEAEMQRLAKRVRERDFRLPAAASGSCTPAGVVDAYCEAIGRRAAATLDGPPGARVVVDAGNGCYSGIAPRVLRGLGYDVVELNCEPDGTFPNRDPNPAVPANLAELRGVVQSSGAAMGVGYDGDGDRSVFVDERGSVVDNDRALVLLARLLLRRREPATGLRNEVVYDIKCSGIVPEQVRAAGGVPVMERSGHAFIKTTLIQRHALFAGEVSGHFFFGEMGGDDGLYATALMLEAIAEDGRGLAAMASELPRYPITPDLRLPAGPEQTTAALAQLEAAFAGDPACEVSLLDGVRVAWRDGWLLARSSVTEPLLTVRAEAHTRERLAEILEVAGRKAPELGKVLGSKF